MSKHIQDTEAAHKAARKLGAGWENITAFGAAINGTPIVAIDADLYTTLQTAAKASAGKTDLGVMLADVAANASPVDDPASIGPTHETTLCTRPAHQPSRCGSNPSLPPPAGCTTDSSPHSPLAVTNRVTVSV